MLAAPMRERASVSIAFMFGTGSRVETADECGLAHFIEHMVFKGGETLSHRARDQRGRRGGGRRAQRLHGPRGHDLLGQGARRAPRRGGRPCSATCSSRPRLLPDDVDRERQVVIEELRMYEDSPQDHVQTLFDAVMWPDHPLGWDVAGTEATVQSFTADDCRRHLRAPLPAR